jgi:hypothetical protein
MSPVGAVPVVLPVGAADLVDECLFRDVAGQADVVDELEDAAHVRGGHARQLALAQIALEDVVEQGGVVEVLGNRDVDGAVKQGTVAGSEAGELVDEVDSAKEYRGDGAHDKVAHAAGQAHTHGQEHEADVARRAGDAPEAHEREGARHGDAGCPRCR